MDWEVSEMGPSEPFQEKNAGNIGQQRWLPKSFKDFYLSDLEFAMAQMSGQPYVQMRRPFDECQQYVPQGQLEDIVLCRTRPLNLLAQPWQVGQEQQHWAAGIRVVYSISCQCGL